MPDDTNAAYAAFRPSGFLTSLKLIPLPGRHWLIGRDLVFESEVLGCRIIVPRGFTCDLNSIPRFLWWISTPTDYPYAGSVHDFLYSRRSPVSRLEADQVYREILAREGMGRIRRQLRYSAIRTFGRWRYKGRH